MLDNTHHSCPICKSVNVKKFNSYKHYCYSCGDCNSIYHEKKNGRYFLEYIFPSKLASKILPQKAFLRLFHAPKDYKPSSFYDIYSAECQSPNAIRRSEIDELKDNLALIDVTFQGKTILDISGGPGLVVKELGKIAKRAVVTEYNDSATDAMSKVLGIEAVKYSYLTDKLENIFDEKFDIVLIRSSIIFCDDLEKLIESVNSILEDGGIVFVETIIPTLGEVFWWQQMEFKFPRIYSQEYIEKLFYKYGFSLKFAHREYGSYTINKWRRKTTLGRTFFTWFVDFPMMLLYYLFSPKSSIAIDQKTHHKMLTQIWQKKQFNMGDASPIIKDSNISKDIQSTHFTQVYNGWLKNLKNR
jgi:2-polyprenyl-3-methyl-5-hydroxy-6-metoxy-1,4-benzoquinol methylase